MNGFPSECLRKILLLRQHPLSKSNSVIFPLNSQKKTYQKDIVGLIFRRDQRADAK